MPGKANKSTQRQAVKIPIENNTQLRPSMMIYPDKTMQVTMLELTVLWEENMPMKGCLGNIYISQRHWHAQYEPINIGGRGFPGGCHFARCCQNWGGDRLEKKTRSISKTAEEASRWT